MKEQLNKPLPYTPFGLDTRTRLESENSHPNMDYLTTMLAGFNLSKYGSYLNDVTYNELLRIDEDVLDSIDRAGNFDQEKKGSRGQCKFV